VKGNNKCGWEKKEGDVSAYFFQLQLLPPFSSKKNYYLHSKLSDVLAFLDTLLDIIYLNA